MADSLSFDSTFMVPGQPIVSLSEEEKFLRGHGSFILENSDGKQLVSCVAGQIERVNKLITVKAVKSRLVKFRMTTL